MATYEGHDAKICLRALLDHGHHDLPFGTQALNEGFKRQDPQGWLWKVKTERPGLRDPAAYTELENVSFLKDILHKSPAAALEIDSAATNGEQAPYNKAQSAYLSSSIDVTMKGGVTSGVVYPLALCELARQFRLRNIGGASAGAIAAAFAAAAEVGRATAGTEQPITTAEFQKTAEYEQGRCRRGFAGLADIIAWLAQLDDITAKKPKEEFRTAQLFKPANVAMRIFRLMAALMRRRYWALPILAATSFGRRLGIVSVCFVLVLPAVLCLATFLAVGAPPTNPVLVYAIAAVWLSGISIALFGLTVAAFLLFTEWRARKRKKEQAKLMTAPKLLVPERKPRSTSPVPYLVMSIVGVAAVAGISLGTATWHWLGFSRSALTWLLGVLIVAVMMVSSIARLISRAKIHRFGLIDGSTRSVDTRQLGKPFNRMMGLPKLTVKTNITDWLDQCLSDLAGKNIDATQPECVLRFGHLWSKSYTPPSDREGSLKQRSTMNDEYAEPLRRMVNLELMATELVHRVPYRFPLKQNEPLYFRPADLESIFPKRVIDAMCAVGAPDSSDDADLAGGNNPSGYCNIDTDDKLLDLRRLPDPWDLPVVFAVRISMAFPGLFTAVKLYRETANPLAVVRDDFGAPIVDEKSKPIRYPESGKWMQELWFSDGGIASNFPIHFFDSVLPLWPTVGINLGPHPKGYPHQDVYLPTDRQATVGIPTQVGRSMLNFLSAVFDTARNWRDTVQTFMPASRGRIAWVRQRRNEGGTNLFMRNEDVAALALRGAVAGARLRRRFASEAQWQRHQWLRLRGGLKNLADLDTRIQLALRETRYARITGGCTEATAAMSDTVRELKKAADPTPPGADPFSSPSTSGEEPMAAARAAISDSDGVAELPFEWFEPQGSDFWLAAQRLLATHNSMDLPTTPLSTRAPEPTAALRQVPSI